MIFRFLRKREEEACLNSQTQTPAAILTLLLLFLTILFPVSCWTSHFQSNFYASSPDISARSLCVFLLKKKLNKKSNSPLQLDFANLFTPKTLQAQTCACFAGAHL